MPKIELYNKFCVICGSTRGVNKKDYIPKKLILNGNSENDDLGFICDKCLNHIADGNIFRKY